MAQKKKLQVFVSSTYTDLHEERQAAVEAILTAGHIPAGMELFAAGDESQMSVIKRWIDESDVYLLILGGRYGTIEPTTKKSYIHLEYEYAIEKNKPFFAVVIDKDHLEEKVKKFGSGVIETDNSPKLKEFEAQVLSKLVKFWRDPRDIKLAIMETMADFSRRDDLVGWIPGNEAVNTGVVAEEIARLAKENADLRLQISSISPDPSTYQGLTFDQMYRVLSQEKTGVAALRENTLQALKQVAETFGDQEPSLIHLFWLTGTAFKNRDYVATGARQPMFKALSALQTIGLVEQTNPGYEQARFNWTSIGRQFYLRLILERNTASLKELLDDKALV